MIPKRSLDVVSKEPKKHFVYNKVCNVSYAMLYNVTIDVGLINYAFCLANMYLEEENYLYCGSCSYQCTFH